PRNFRKLDGGARSVEGFNPLCGDKVTVYVDVEADVVRDVSFEGSGCAISTASASVMTETLKGKSRAEAEALFRRFHSLVTEGPLASEGASLGKLAVFAGVSEFPSRVKCAVLAWHTLRAALEGKEEPVSTE
ncbi:MAG: Fe-S cluster assembly sulfur transfer protein SufU, partial [Candidatus Binatia bacterium]